MSFIDQILFFAAIVLLSASIFLSFRTKFVQIRMLPDMCKSLFRRGGNEEKHTVVPKKALFTAMSTTLGVGTIISSTIAIKLGGPGALVGYLLATFFGTATTFTEVSLAVAFRKRTSDGKILGGPMQYLEKLFSPGLAKWYATCTLILLSAWCGAQSNQLAAMLESPSLGNFFIPKAATGTALAVLITVMQLKGIKWIARFSEMLVPIMFALYVGACLWIIGLNADRLPDIFTLVCGSSLSPCALASGAIVGGIANSMRWGIFRGVYSTEAGLGTQTFPHSMAETNSPSKQGVLSMTSVYSAGLLAILSGVVALITNTWQDSTLPLGISMVVKSFEMYFSWGGAIIIGLSVILFAVGTVLGNAYNGSHCFFFLANFRCYWIYLLLIAAGTFLGAVCDATAFWGFCDIFAALSGIPHVLALSWIAWKGHPALEIQSYTPAVKATV